MMLQLHQQQFHKVLTTGAKTDGADPPSSWSSLCVYNSGVNNMGHLMFEYILNWPDHRLDSSSSEKELRRNWAIKGLFLCNKILLCFGGARLKMLVHLGLVAEDAWENLVEPEIKISLLSGYEPRTGKTFLLQSRFEQKSFLNRQPYHNLFEFMSSCCLIAYQWLAGCLSRPIVKGNKESGQF